MQSRPEFDTDARTRRIQMSTMPKFSSGFVAVNPNSKIPALMDRSDGANPMRVFESGAILLYLPEIAASGPRRAGAERAAINAPMQGTAADLIKLAMVAVHKELDAEKPAIKMIMQVHDELVFELPEGEVDWLRREIPRLMAGVAALQVPLLAEVGVGPDWDKAH